MTDEKVVLDGDDMRRTLVRIAHEIVEKTPEPELLALTHVSTRYAGYEVRDEARGVFEHTELPRDFDTIEIPFPEKGEPELIRWADLQQRTAPA